MEGVRGRKFLLAVLRQEDFRGKHHRLGECSRGKKLRVLEWRKASNDKGKAWVQGIHSVHYSSTPPM